MTSISPAAVMSRRVAVAGLAGTFIEYFEFLSYGQLTVVIAPQFFPSNDHTSAVLAGLLVFATGYLVRPLGGIVFGWIGDRSGRRVALVSTVLLMGTASVLMGLLPTYTAVGVLAPILLISVRLLQGFSAGGEIIGAATYVVESAPAHRRSFYAAITPVGSALGIGFAGVVAGTIALSTTPAELSAWGWRIPFLLCLPLTVFALWVRLELEDSPEFRELVAKSQIVKAPLLTALRSQPIDIARVAAIACVVNLVAAVGQTYMVIHLISDRHMGQAQAFLLTGAMQVFNGLGVLIGGRLNGRIGMPKVLALGLTASLVIAIPVFQLIDAVTRVAVVSALIAVWLFVLGLQTASMFGICTDLFPNKIRYSAAALGVNIGIIFGAGLTPYASQRLVTLTHNASAPAYLVVIAAALGLLVLAVSYRAIAERMRQNARRSDVLGADTAV